MNRDQINELYAGRIFSRETQLAARARIHWICSQVQGEKVLDIGCSQGIICLLLGREGFDCVGVDIEQDAIDYALEELKKEEDIVQRRVVFQVADAARLDFDENTFDTVILGEVLEHLVHPEKVLREAQRVLKESGRIIITVPLGLNSHPDHKRTFYPVSFLETVQPFFQTISVDTLTNYIIYCGKKEAAYDPSQISEKALLAELLSVQKKTDERNLAREIDFEQTAKNLYEQQKKLHEQIAALNSQIVSNQETNTALRNSLNENIVSLKQQITHLQWQIASQKQQIASQEQQNVSLQSKIDDLGIELNETRFYKPATSPIKKWSFNVRCAGASAASLWAVCGCCTTCFCTQSALAKRLIKGSANITGRLYRPRCRWGNLAAYDPARRNPARLSAAGRL
ncbi:MAG: methyltransferase domain-containing protein [Anaerolineales bacterium]|nr:methyltransferase domain-containing protein [Anaerolineales bacterium]